MLGLLPAPGPELGLRDRKISRRLIQVEGKGRTQEVRSSRFSRKAKPIKELEGLHRSGPALRALPGSGGMIQSSLKSRHEDLTAQHMLNRVSCAFFPAERTA